MSIPVSCNCGKHVNAPDHLAGKTVKCPGCGNPLTIPAAASSASSLFDEAGISEGGCPKCGAAMNAGAVLCVACGYNRETGEEVEGVASKTGGHGGAAQELLSRAEAEMENRPVRNDGAYGNKGQEWGVMAGMLVFALVVVVGFYAFFQYMEAKHERDKAKEQEEQRSAIRMDAPAVCLQSIQSCSFADAPAPYNRVIL